MDYQKIYNQIIERSKSRLLEGFTERHHIIPKCMGGSNKKDNIAILTIKEHRVAHACLHLIYPNNPGLALAYVKMFYGNRWQHRDRITPLRVYEEARILASTAAREKRLGKTYEQIMGADKALKKKTHHSNVMIGRTWSEERKKSSRKPKPLGFGKKVSEALRGRVFSETTINKMRLKARKIAQCDLEGNIIKIWPSVREAAKILKFSRGNMAKVCNKEHKTLKGYRWKDVN